MSDELTQVPSSAGGDEGLLLGAALPERPSPAVPTSYRVLARKYRPSSFDDLIGQEPMVRTLANAFELGRIHQAYILTGVRGVGKTTTARILARAFNYELPAQDGRPPVTKPTIHMPELGVHCSAIIESRHVDVIEMDAASHTGIDDIRELIESARYRPVMARTKVYIIDEVHMLSKQAFNGLLKTLEEPPEHVRFLFATTEIDKVPVTVRSRCQRFDLRRVEAEVLIRHLAGVCAKENVAIEPQALALIARAAEGSVRDALSLLDQAIAYGAGTTIGAESMRMMLGVADRSRVVDLFEEVMKGDVATALANLKEQYDQGTDPVHVLVELAEFVHFVTRLKLVPQTRGDPSVSEEEFSRAGAFAKALGMAVLTRAWQLLAKGIQDVKDSPRPLAAADMVLVRLAYAADLPTPDEVLRRIAATPSERGGGRPLPSASSSIPSSGAGTSRAAPPPVGALAVARPEPGDTEPRIRLARFEDVVALAQSKRDIQLKIALESDVRLVRFEEGSIEFSLVPGASPQLVPALTQRLQEWTGMRWMVAVSRAAGAPTLKEQAALRQREQLTGAAAEPLVRSVLERFPGAEIVAVRRPEPAAEDNAPSLGEANDEVAYADQIYTEDDL
jgi:DNA polymerase-3 subunit gamma/tau